MELEVLGPLQVRKDGAPVVIPGAKPRAILTMLGLHGGSVVPATTLVELLWGDTPPRTAAKALQTHISSLRHALGDGFVLTEGTGWRLSTTEVDALRYKRAAGLGRAAAAAGDTSGAVARFGEAVALWRGVPELPDGRRGTSEKTRWVEGHAALIEDRADALLMTGRAAEIIGELEASVTDAPLRERRWGQLMLALYRAGRQGEALGAYRRARTLLADELGIDPGPELRRLEAAIVAQDDALDLPATQHVTAVTRAVTFLLTDIVGSTAAWEADADAMAVALARHDEIVEQVVTSRGGRLIKTRGEGDATFTVFDRPSAAAAAAIELQDAILQEPWALAEPMRIRVALHTGEAELRDGDYFGRSVNRAARLRSLATGGQILCSGATAELVIDSLSDDVVLVDLGTRQLKNLTRPEHVFELRLDTNDNAPPPSTPPIERLEIPAVLTGSGPFVGRGPELGELLSTWQTALTAGTQAVLIAGEPGVGKTRLAGEWSRQAYEDGAVVLYGRCDEDLGAPYQPFTEALRTLVPSVGPGRLRGIRGIEAILPLVPGLIDAVPDLTAPTRADPDTERYALFDAVVALLEAASASVPIVLVLDDLHWAAKPTLLLLRHLLRFGEHARVQIVGTYRSTDLDRSHPLAAMLADLHRDGAACRMSLSGLDTGDVAAYVAEAGYDDEELANALASVTGGNPFFLIEALRHVNESGGRWDPSTLPQGVREAVSRRLSRLSPDTNKALSAAAVVGSRFTVDLVERVLEQDLIDAFDEACTAGIVIEEPGGRYRFNHAIVRQSLLAELASVRRMRLHQRIATTLETEPARDDERLAELAYHYFECAWAGNAFKAVEYCRRAADQAMARLAYEGAAELYDHALHALEELDDELPDRDDRRADLLIARCEALLAAGDVTSAATTLAQLQQQKGDSARLTAWTTCFDGQLSILIHPERLDELESALRAAADRLAELGDGAGEATAHTVRATCLARLGRIADCESALDHALSAARRAREHRRVNNVLAGAPLAALWGPSPVPRAGGRCLDVVRLLRITSGSPVVETISTRCQAVLEAYRGRGGAARRMIDSARRTVTELGLRHATLEVEHFAGIIELTLDDPAAAELHLRLAYNGFRRMRVDADTAETAALLGRACMLLGRDEEADELCAESERLAGHALKASIAWRVLRAQLLSRDNDHDKARRVAEAAVSLVERTDALVDHGDACLALAMVLGAAGDTSGMQSAAERAAALYEQKEATALVEKARRLVGDTVRATTPVLPEIASVELETSCVRAGERLMAAVDRRAWDDFEQLFAAAATVESRRKIVGFKPVDVPSDWVHQNRLNLETGGMRVTATVIAVRGERLALSRLRVGTADMSAGAPEDELLQVYGIDDAGLIALQVWFDRDDFDAAIAELDARYLAGEAAPHAHTWVVIADAYAALNRRELPAATPDWVDADHRQPVTVDNGDLGVSLNALWDITSQATIYVEAVHRLGEIGAVTTHVASATSKAGFDAEWRDVCLLTVDGDRLSRAEAFDEADLRGALARFDELSAPTARPENMATHVYERMKHCYGSGNWAALAEMHAENISNDDRRMVVNAGVQQGRDAVIREISAIAGVGATNWTSHTVAIRGQYVALNRARAASGELPEDFHTDVLDVIEIDADGLVVARVVFDPDDIDAAFAELDARYLAGEAAPFAQTWSAIVGAYAAFNRRELAATTPDWVNVDNRRGAAFQPGDMISYLEAAWDDSPDTEIRIVAVHQLSNLGAVVTHVAQGMSREGFRAEWRDTHILMVDGELISRCELFDETDLAAALARFQELSSQAPQLENTASKMYERFHKCFAERDLAAIAAMLAEDFYGNDRRRLVGSGIRHGRDAALQDARAITELGISITATAVIATRGDRLVLRRSQYVDEPAAAYHVNVLEVVGLNSDERIDTVITLDPDDIEAAFAELDARYLAGEAAAHAHTWSAIMAGYAAFNRHELPPTTPDWENVDRRRAIAFAPGEQTSYIQATWDVTPQAEAHVETVHRLTGYGALVTQAVHGTSPEGFDAEWREIALLTLAGDLINRCELFDEADLAAALARFEELGHEASAR
ncbi:BTAD domain-containing putative transcriptional regulator [Mycobacterium sp. 852013-50091_SCH5140682]|uniref:BTAD domain-containing putative transcriptional regulator n=1 Tax=Mycobacterium sp. 852013-50091_SCH5140682 TaxID=1834109 RepID=UPI0018D2DA65|nr:BTAD domain-containing putative transcriptional regulator [Mycobacterium sp. 852013-50091_SCH5140682]